MNGNQNSKGFKGSQLRHTELRLSLKETGIPRVGTYEFKYFKQEKKINGTQKYNNFYDISRI